MERIGFPVILKATAGGGGRGMKIVDEQDAAVDALATARTEAQAAFGNPDDVHGAVLQRPRHIEIQVIGDSTAHDRTSASASARSSAATRS